MVTLGGEDTSLTAREFDLLRFFMAHPGVAFSRDDLLQQVWGWSFGDQSTVTVHVRRLREKIEVDPTTPTRLLTVWGVGYRWEPQPMARGVVMADLTEIWLTSAASGLVVGMLGLLAGWLLRHRIAALAARPRRGRRGDRVLVGVLAVSRNDADLRPRPRVIADRHLGRRRRLARRRAAARRRPGALVARRCARTYAGSGSVAP